MTRLRLGVNIDHVATVRNARGGAYPDPFRSPKSSHARASSIKRRISAIAGVRPLKIASPMIK